MSFLKSLIFVPEKVTWFSHGTTVGVNTVIQRTGAVLSLLVTDGFEDVLELARLKVPDPYDIFFLDDPLPLFEETVFMGSTSAH